MITSEEIKSRLWNGANELRGSMDASRYKDYMLGLMFYKFLSDQTLKIFAMTAGLTNEDNWYDAYVESHANYGEELEKMIQDVVGYYVSPKHLYQTWIKDMNEGHFEVQKVADSLNQFERNIAVTKDSDDFKGIFANSTLDLSDTALGSNLNERSKNIQALIRLFEDLDMVALQDGDILGDAYEYLIGQFAMESGKKAGEFYTPRQVSEVMAQIVATNEEITSIYDPTVGSGSLLLTVKKHLSDENQKRLNYYGQEKNTATYNLTRMNLLLHGIRPEKMTIKNGDTLSYDWPEDPEKPNEGVQFDAVVMNPPYSIKNWNRSGLKPSDPRFEIAGVLPPDSKGDYAFLLHGLYHLGITGTMAIVLPHGVLFRGATEGEIRKRLLEKNQIDAVIGLPSNLFTNTGIPVCIIILKKNRELNDPILFIDASKSFIKSGKQNALQEKDIAKIVDVYQQRVEEKGYSHLATRQELMQNDYNMNIPRYVETIDEEIPHDVDAHLYGGIPEQNIKELKVLNKTVNDVLSNAFIEKRHGYLELTKSIEELSSDILSHSGVRKVSDKIREVISDYIEEYWERLHQLNENTNTRMLREDMLDDIKKRLETFDQIDIYEGYQIIAEIWTETLTHDAELIEQLGYYTAGRTREPNMVVKGKNKDKVQDGWKGVIIPNSLIASELFASEQSEIEELKLRLLEIDSELSELIEEAKVEDSEEYNALFDSIKKNDEGEAQDSFDRKLLKESLKNSSKETSEYVLLKKVDDDIKNRTAVNKLIKIKEQELKELVSNRIEQLTDDEIDQLLYKKWFGKVVEKALVLVETPLKGEIAIIEQLHQRYSDTIADIDGEIALLETELKSLMKDLVVIK
ncbi:type I restriction-modification system subunit M [Streptococcus pacificus]|uniref:site-specific DNA-methyltransferase (adenine-specific) n=1 Tax=Streptococcus pacificus TaxID=2740577 RepID=A0ABS0ZJ25_9STRE|nr:type I restriction-modification system subunit M [Streptococcus pacificus]MBJ8325858.1 type I restriction-modification system subunit M [Streptococcus pacificus]